MSGLIRTNRRLFGFSPGGRGNRSKAEQLMGTNRAAYYGNAANALLAEKHGARKYAQYVQGLGAVRSKHRLDSLPSGSGQLLGGGG